MAGDGSVEDVHRRKPGRRPVPLVVAGHGSGSALHGRRDVALDDGRIELRDATCAKGRLRLEFFGERADSGARSSKSTIKFRVCDLYGALLALLNLYGLCCRVPIWARLFSLKVRLDNFNLLITSAAKNGEVERTNSLGELFYVATFGDGIEVVA
jgi:hypothetical protein